MAARLQYVTDGDEPVTYELDQVATILLDTKRQYPESEAGLTIPARDLTMALALMRMSLKALEEFDA